MAELEKIEQCPNVPYPEPPGSMRITGLHTVPNASFQITPSKNPKDPAPSSVVMSYTSDDGSVQTQISCDRVKTQDKYFCRTTHASESSTRTGTPVQGTLVQKDGQLTMGIGPAEDFVIHLPLHP